MPQSPVRAGSESDRHGVSGYSSPHSIHRHGWCRPFHGNLPLLVHGSYGTPLLFGQSRKMMNHEPVHPTNSSLSISPHEIHTFDDPKTPILHACASRQYANAVWSH